MSYYRIGIIVKPHGIRGYVKVKSETDFPDRFFSDKDFTVETSTGYRTFQATDVRVHGGGGFILKLKGIESANEAELFRGCEIVVDETKLHPLESDTYYIHDIIGCTVYDEKNTLIGTVSDIFPTGSNDIYVVTDAEGKEHLVPAIKDIVTSVDIQAKRIEITVIEGLFS